MRITATIQARMGSSRLPGKVIKPICGKPMLAWQIERIKRSRIIDEIVVATTTSFNDNVIKNLTDELNVQCYRGPEDDVLGRIAQVMKEFNVDIHVELIGDSPLTDPQIVDEILAFYIKNRNQFDYVANGMRSTYPSGMEVSVYEGRKLIELEREVSPNDPMREHVEVHLSKNSNLSRCNIAAPSWFYAPNLFLEVDTKVDFEMISLIIEHFVRLDANHFSLSQILDYINQHPEIAEINRSEHRRWRELKPELSGIVDTEKGVLT